MIVWLASYPRSGNTFLRVILKSVFNLNTYSIYGDGHDIGATVDTAEIVGHKRLEKGFTLENGRKEECAYILKTHEEYTDDIDQNDKIIYLIRDGRECTLSFTKHQNIYSNQNKKIIDTIYGNSFVGSWGEHVSSWDPKRRKSTLLIRFEDLVSKPEAFIGPIGEFINAIPVSMKIPTFDELKAIDGKFFRSGKMNSWEQEFTEEDHLAFWLKNYYQMIEYGYEYQKPDVVEGCNDIDLLVCLTKENTYIMKEVRDIRDSVIRIVNSNTEKQKDINNIKESIEDLRNQLEEMRELTEKFTGSRGYEIINAVLHPLDKIKGNKK